MLRLIIINIAFLLFFFIEKAQSMQQGNFDISQLKTVVKEALTSLYAKKDKTLGEVIAKRPVIVGAPTNDHYLTTVIFKKLIEDSVITEDINKIKASIMSARELLIAGGGYESLRNALRSVFGNYDFIRNKLSQNEIKLWELENKNIPQNIKNIIDLFSESVGQIYGSLGNMTSGTLLSNPFQNNLYDILTCAHTLKFGDNIDIVMKKLILIS